MTGTLAQPLQFARGSSGRTGNMRSITASFGFCAVMSLAAGCVEIAPEDAAQIEEEGAVAEVQQALNTTPGEGLYRFSPKNAPHKSWDLPGACAGQSNGARLALYHYDGHYCGGGGDQKWYIRYVGNDGQNYYE